jgi:hypothetical protein
VKTLTEEMALNKEETGHANLRVSMRKLCEAIFDPDEHVGA